MPLSAESNLPHFAVHECGWLTEIGVQVVFGELNGQRRTWWLYVFREAIEEDLEAGRADYVGELLEYHQYPIRHCPYCGAELFSELPTKNRS